MEKKGAIDLTELAISIVILGIAVSIGATILTNVRDARLTDLDSIETVNETLTTVTETGEALVNEWVSGVTVCNLLNDTGQPDIAAANYTVAIDIYSGTGTVSFSGADGYGLNNSDWNCTYNWYNTSRSDWKLPNQASIGLAEYGNWFKIIVIVGVAAVVLGLIFLAFGNKGRGTSVSY